VGLEVVVGRAVFRMWRRMPYPQIVSTLILRYADAVETAPRVVTCTAWSLRQAHRAHAAAHALTHTNRTLTFETIGKRRTKNGLGRFLTPRRPKKENGGPYRAAATANVDCHV
jgi:hypothetical protein